MFTTIDSNGQKTFREISKTELANVSGGESIGHVLRSLPEATGAPLNKTYGTTVDFIKNHPFFHEGLMNAPIGGGKHFRNVPFIGPGRMLLGGLTGNGSEVLKGIETTRGTWDAQ